MPIGSEGSPVREDNPGDGRALESPWLLLNWVGQRRFCALLTAEDALCRLVGASLSDAGSDIPTMALADVVARDQALSSRQALSIPMARNDSRVAQ
jgi:hypothetical protein